MKLFQRRPILAFSLICITINIYCASGGKITPPHVINVREGMGSSSDESSPIPTLSAVPWGQLSPRADDLGEFPDDDSDMEPLTEHQLAQRYLAHFSGNTTAAMPHLVKVFEQNAQAKHGLERFMQKTTRGGIQPLFVKVRELIHA